MDIEEKKEIKNKLLKSFLKKYDENKESIILFLENQYKILNEKKRKINNSGRKNFNNLLNNKKRILKKNKYIKV